jgi:hypothetical protein
MNAASRPAETPRRTPPAARMIVRLGGSNPDRGPRPPGSGLTFVWMSSVGSASSEEVAMSVTLMLAAVFERRRSGGFLGQSWVNTLDLLGEVPPPKLVKYEVRALLLGMRLLH